MVVLLLITGLLRLYINTIEGRRDIDSSFALVASNLEYNCFTSRRDTDTQMCVFTYAASGVNALRCGFSRCSWYISFYSTLAAQEIMAQPDTSILWA